MLEHGSEESIKINDKTKFCDILPDAKIYIDKSKSLTIQDILQIKNEFKENDTKNF